MSVKPRTAHSEPAPPSAPLAASETPRFATDDRFRKTLRRRVEEYFANTGRRQRGASQLYFKTAIVLGALAGSYALLVFVPMMWWTAVPLALLLGLSIAAVGFNIQHDGGHAAYSERRWVNRLAAATLDLAGGSSYIWARKHNSFHHSYTNVTGHDDDIDVGFLGRLSPHQPRHALHRLQHWYLWILYGFLPIKWHIYDDFRDLIRGRIGRHHIARPQGGDLALLLGGKALFFSLAFVVPMLLHPWWAVLALYVVASFAAGVVLSVVFQLAHCVEEAEFPMPSGGSGRMASAWAEHQVQTTVDFAPRNRLLTWYIGGLNYQIEHHLFPHVCHVHYPALAPIVAQTCGEFGLRYSAQPTLRAGVASHYRWLKRMGRPLTSARQETAAARQGACESGG